MTYPKNDAGAVKAWRAHDRALAQRWRRDGDVAALHELVSRNRLLAASQAHRFNRYGLDFDDRYQVAVQALTLAARQWKPGRCAFSTWATPFMTRALIEYVSRQARAGVTIGGAGRRRLAVFGLGRARQALLDEGIQPTPANLAAALDISESVAAVLDQATRPPLQLDHSTTETTTAADSLVDSGPDPEQQLLGAETRAQLVAALQTLPAPAQTIVEAIYIDGIKAGTLARRLRMKRADVIAVAANALATLRTQLSDGDE